MSLNNYNSIAPYYQLFSRLVYGRLLLSIQQDLIKTLPKKGNLLILGGGDGTILPLIASYAPNLSLHYVEASSTMISLAKSKSPIKQTIIFYHTDDILLLPEKMDALYAAFFFDLFDESTIAYLIERWTMQLSSSATWHIADFDAAYIPNGRWYRKIQLKASIIFFKTFTDLTLSKLPNVFKVFHTLKFKTLYTSELSGGFLRCQVFYQP